LIRFKAKVPSARFNSSFFVSDMRNMGNELAKRVDETYKNEVMASWNSKAKFTKEISSTRSLTKVEVKTDSNIYRYLTRGTEGDYDIPKEPGLLRYQVDFIPKTTVGSLKSKDGGKSGPYITKHQVKHPGVEAREYEALIIEEQMDWMKERLTKVLQSSVDLRSG
jgi:hypothetical protein